MNGARKPDVFDSSSSPLAMPGTRLKKLNNREQVKIKVPEGRYGRPSSQAVTKMKWWRVLE
ncbi:hypothetical protein BGW80DRAFT_1347375 [Lactifluus volemus]|nr:hypothetical protein BGW80DRAFT_1347375 [Lactifluus volemus]